MALLESFRRADIKAQNSFKDHQLDEATATSLFDGIRDSLKAGTLKIHTSVADGAEQVGQFFHKVASLGGRLYAPPASDGQNGDADPQLDPQVVMPPDAELQEVVDASAPSVSAQSATDLSRASAEGSSTSAGSRGATPERSGVSQSGLSGTYRVDYQRYPISGYIKLPTALQPFVQLPIMDHVVVVAKPSGDVSGGLHNYREAVPKPQRAAAPIFAVIDAPGKKIKDKGYLWIEIPLADIFKLDVSGLGSMEDYAKLLSKKGRWNFKDRQKKFAQGLTCEYVPLPPGSQELVDSLWPLYKSTGERNGFTVLTEEEFFDFHLTTPDLNVMLIKDKETGALVTFCTGVRAGDTLMPMWCGTDYDNEKSRSCSSYFNMLYEYVKIGIADPSINWIDLGASRRSAKTAIGFTGYPVSIYIRCKNSVQEALYSQMMSIYFKADELINDP